MCYDLTFRDCRSFCLELCVCEREREREKVGRRVRGGERYAHPRQMYLIICCWLHLFVFLFFFLIFFSNFILFLNFT